MIILTFIIGTLFGMWIDRGFIVWAFNKLGVYMESLKVELKKAESVYASTSTTAQTVTENANKSIH